MEFEILSKLISRHCERLSALKNIKYILQLISSYSIEPNQLEQFPTWLIMYSCQIIFPVIGMGAIGFKIILKSGKDLQRELLGVKVVRIKNEKYASVKTSNHPETAFDFLKNFNDNKSMINVYM